MAIREFLLERKFILFIYFYVLLMPWNFEKWQMGALTVILFLWWIIEFRKKITSKIKDIIQFKPLVVFILWLIFMYVSLLWSESIADSLKHLNKFYKYYWFMIPVVFTSLNKEQAKIAIKILLMSFALYALFSILISLGLFRIEETGSNVNNPKGIMAYAIVSVYFAIGSVGSFWIFIYSKSRSVKFIFLLFSVLCLYALMVNNGRTAQLALVLTLISLTLMYFKSLQLKHIILVTLALIISFQILHVNNKLKRFDRALNEVNLIIEKEQYKGSFGVRVYFYKITPEVLEGNWLLGLGSEDNINKLNEYQINDPKSPKRLYNSYHSQHLDTLTRYGLVGYSLLIFSVIWLIYRLRDNKEYFLIGLSFFLVTFYSSMANVMLIKKPFTYIFVLMFVLLSIVAFNKKSSGDNK